MSFGNKTDAVFDALEAEPGGLPANLRRTELVKRANDMLKKAGHKPSELPSPKTLMRYYRRRYPEAGDAT